MRRAGPPPGRRKTMLKTLQITVCLMLTGCSHAAEGKLNFSKESAVKENVQLSAEIENINNRIEKRWIEISKI